MSASGVVVAAAAAVGGDDPSLEPWGAVVVGGDGPSLKPLGAVAAVVEEDSCAPPVVVVVGELATPSASHFRPGPASRRTWGFLHRRDRHQGPMVSAHLGGAMWMAPVGRAPIRIHSCLGSCTSTLFSEP